MPQEQQTDTTQQSNIMQKEIPLLFSTPMVQAIIDGRKTVTRRIIKPQPSDSWMKNVHLNFPDGRMFDRKGKQRFWLTRGSEMDEILCPYGKPGDLLYVREMFCLDERGRVAFRADEMGDPKEVKWKPSIPMPKAAARVWLEVTDVRVERLQAISEEDAVSEGIEVVKPFPLVHRYRDYEPESGEGHYCYPIDSFASLWRSINGGESWLANPWVWVVSFKVLSTTGKPDLAG